MVSPAAMVISCCPALDVPSSLQLGTVRSDTQQTVSLGPCLRHSGVCGVEDWIVAAVGPLSGHLASCREVRLPALVGCRANAHGSNTTMGEDGGDASGETEKLRVAEHFEWRAGQRSEV